MRFSTQTLLALLASPFLVLAADNPFNVPTGGLNSVAGKSMNLTWSPTTSGTVSLILRSGASSDLNSGTYIAQSISNSGSYTWNIPSSVTRGSDYAVEIVDDADSTKTNYTPYFVIDSKNTVASSTTDISLGAPSSSLSLSSASSSGSASASTTGSSSASTTSSGSMSSSTGTASSTGSSSTGSSSMTGSSSSMSTKTSSKASSASAAASSAASSVASGFAAATAIPIGLLALGALAL